MKRGREKGERITKCFYNLTLAFKKNAWKGFCQALIEHSIKGPS